MVSTKITGKASTLYPKITNNLSDVVKRITLYFQNNPSTKLDSIALTGTVKLHGIHADIVIDSSDEVRLQSRNMQSLSLTRDLHGFAARILPLNSAVLNLKSRIYARFSELNVGVDIQQEHPLIIAGEWIGPGVQKNVAIAELPEKLFVIISININNSWLPDQPYGDIYDEENGIYHISKSGFFHHDLPLDEALASLRKLQPLADAVEDECPFGKVFEIIGRGEGIVWKPAPPFCGDAKFWIKMKGPLSKVTPVAQKAIGSGKDEQRAYAKEFAVSVLNEMRLEQGWQYMEEMGIKMDVVGAVEYLKWLVADVEVEEESSIEERKIEWPLLKREIQEIGRKWLFKRLNED